MKKRNRQNQKMERGCYFFANNMKRLQLRDDELEQATVVEKLEKEYESSKSKEVNTSN